MKQYMLINMQPTGSLQVFALVPDEVAASAKPIEEKLLNRVFWMDSKATQPQGPFMTQYAAMENWKGIWFARRHNYVSDMDITTQPQLPLPTQGVYSVEAIPKNNILDLDVFRANRPKKHW